MSIGYVSAVADVVREKFYFPPRVVFHVFSSLASLDRTYLFSHRNEVMNHIISHRGDVT